MFTYVRRRVVDATQVLMFKYTKQKLENIEGSYGTTTRPLELY